MINPDERAELAATDRLRRRLELQHRRYPPGHPEYDPDDHPPEDRSRREAEYLEVGENLTECIYCGSRCTLDDGLYYATGDRLETCNGCGQRFYTEDEDEET